jgi:eukaryotic-like serine/threonine-protein kinase
VIDERLASGGTAEVYLAHPADSEQPAKQVVIKRLLASLRADPASRASFAEEGQLHQRFKHPNIVECYECAEIEGEPLLVMELVNGADLQRVLRVAQTRKRPISPPLACYIGREILNALQAVHAAGVVHRDVSPSNIYLATSGDVKLGDFGIARTTSSGRTPRPGSLGSSIKGKFAYLAPEQVASEDVDHRADLFALANILSEMMLGKPLFPGSGQLAVLLSIRDGRIDALDGPSAIPLPLVNVLKTALARDPARRFAEAKLLADALVPFSLHDATTARRDIAQLVRWARETSMELRAAGEHPDQKAAIVPPPVAMPQPSLRLDSSILRDESGPHKPVPIIHAPSPAPTPSISDNVTAEWTPLPSHVRTADGRKLGPLPYAKLIELVVTGRLSPDDQVDFMGTGFMPLGDIDELARHLAPASSVTKQLQGPGSPDWHGFAAERYDEEVGGAIEPGVATALSFAATREAAGVLLAQHGTTRKEIYFDNGRVIHVSSTEAGEMIGEYLVARGLLDRGDLDFALAVLPRFNGRLGEALTGLGVIEPVAMFNAIKDQGRDKIVEIFSWSDGELSFYLDAAPSRVEFKLDIAIGPIVEAGVRSMLDPQRATARFKPWLNRRLRRKEMSASLRSAGWSDLVEHALSVAAQTVVVRGLLDALIRGGATEHDAICAVESARVSGMLGWSP